MLLHSEGQVPPFTVSELGGSVVSTDSWSASFHFCPDPDSELLLQTGMTLQGSEAICSIVGSQVQDYPGGGGVEVL